ncbi:MAG: hypothetical protein ACREQ9_04200, partial [Candidatus Binatia bacterium]
MLRQVLPSVVELKAKIPDDHPSSAILGSERMGTGTIVDRGGLVLTVNYVVIGATSVEVTLFDGRTVVAGVASQDYSSGLAVLR